MTKVICLLHDDQQNHTDRIKCLEFAGYKVEISQDAPACLMQIEDTHPALIISDVLLHGMTGFDFCHAVRQRFTPKRLPFLLCSGVFRGRVYQQEAMQIGCQEYLVEPFLLDDLIKRVNELTGGAKREAA